MSLPQQVRHNESCRDQKNHEREIDNQQPNRNDRHSLDVSPRVPRAAGRGTRLGLSCWETPGDVVL